MARQRTTAHGAEQPPLSRRTFWRLTTALVVAVAVVVFLVSSGVLSKHTATVVSRAATATAAFWAMLAWLFSALWHPAGRRWRQCMTLASACFLCGELTWIVGQSRPQHRGELGVTASVLLIATVLLSSVAMLIHAFSPHGPLLRRRATSGLVTPVLDLLIMLVSTALFVLVGLGFPLQRTSVTEVPHLVSVTVEPLAYLLLLATIVILARFRREVRDLPTAFVALAAMTYVIAGTAFARSVDEKVIDIPPQFESWYVATPVLLGLAALAPSLGEEVPRRRLRRATREVGLLSIPYLPLIASVVLAAVGTLTNTEMPIEQALTFLMLLLLVIARQLVTLAENRRLLRKTEHEALHDPLTGLANRTLFMEELERALRVRANRLVLAFCDMDDFKEINDSYGHVAGDEVLIRTAHRLKQCASPGDTVARLGGDEFALLLRDPAESLSSIERRLLTTLQEPHALRDDQRVVSASVGVTTLPAGAELAGTDELLHLADTAMYTAKQQGKNTLAYLPDPREESTR